MLRIEVETWTDANLAPLDDRLHTHAVTESGGASVRIAAGSRTLLIEADTDGLYAITHYGPLLTDEGIELHTGRLVPD